MRQGVYFNNKVIFDLWGKAEMYVWHWLQEGKTKMEGNVVNALGPEMLPNKSSDTSQIF